MYLKEIELSGFKSFGKKTALSFSTPVTGIVGPNGSGKSNVVEAIRFVLGEQSMKSLRGKAGVDLIFKGSKSLSALSRASVTIVFDNKKKIFSFADKENSINLDFDEISISREVYSDGANVYKLNGSEVRLKDIVELLASVNIGSSGHHIISQGEADRILNASPKDRRAMVEDALGLKIFQYKIRESERKLEKTTLNMKEVMSLRREIAPHIAFLKKQVEKIEKVEVMRNELRDMYVAYFGIEAGYIRDEKLRLQGSKAIVLEKLAESEKHIIVRDSHSQEDEKLFSELREKEMTLRSYTTLRQELSHKIGRIEGTIEALSTNANAEAEEEEKISVPLSEIETLAGDIERTVKTALSVRELTQLHDALSAIAHSVSAFITARKKINPKEENREKENERIAQEKILLEKVNDELEALAEKENTLKNGIEELRSGMREAEAKARDHERLFYEAKARKTELESELHLLSLEENALGMIETDFSEELKEAVALVGHDAVRYTDVPKNNDAKAVRSMQTEAHKKIERIKIKLEDAGAAGGNEILKEYRETTERDVFLSKELDDLEKSIEQLRGLIHELKDTLDTRFKVGIEKINKEFQEFFALMFGGGHAFLSIVVEHKRPSRKDDEEDEVVSDMEEGEEELEFERGIDINVSLPHKKVRELNMLSGGERSLTSIALLFAMSQVNPPPFLVLDETDAALDEANSKKYGNMIENLSKYSQLIVVTHNRETMSRADVLYGVTIGSDGASKLLSIKFEEAVQIAK